MPADPAQRPSATRAVVLALLFVGFAWALKTPSLDFEHDEPDELVYQSVAQNLLERGSYTLRGASVLARLSPGIYDHPLFHHPPLYPLLLVPFVALDAPQVAVLVSWLGHALCILAVAAIGAVLLRRTGGDADFLWIPLLGVATDPLLVHVARKLWIDALLAGLMASSVALVYVALDARHRRRWLLAAGLVLGLAGLAKLPGLLAGVVVLPLILGVSRSWRERVVDLSCFAMPCLLLVLPWIVVFLATYGVPAPTWLRPDEFSLGSYPFIAMAVGRPWYYYLAKLPLITPVVAVALAGFLLPGARRTDPTSWTPLVWFFLLLGVATLQGSNGYGFQMRYLAPLVPAIYAMLACHPSLVGPGRHRWLHPALVLLIVYGAMQGTLYLLGPGYDEMASFPELLGLLAF